ncbi:hypothetical protein Cni_G11264 [Canna indica]|uniref:RRM domain-containing protein n=1 Tax=Canna indica TaxID=4628 RepID=A0AAQ3K5Z2_9LILI|nr:hypothetical protein Cni_G11264 [Canna indica]
MSKISSSLDKLHKIGATECLEFPNSYILKDQKKTESSLEHHQMEQQRATNVSTASKLSDHVSRSQSSLLAPPPLFGEGDVMDLSGLHYENGLFSSSLSDIFSKKLRLSSSIAPMGQSIDSVNSNFGEDEPFESMEEIEAQTIGNLLPDDDDLLSGVIDDIGYIGRSNNGNDIDDDIFYSGGGMELESDDNINGNKTSVFVGGGAFSSQLGEPNGIFAGEHPYGEHPSRTLFVRNINSNVEDAELRALFEQYGDIRTLYTACKHRGFVMISYYDIRAARNAMRALQNKPLRRRKLDIHFSIPKDNPSDKDVNQGTLVVFNLDSSVTNDDLHMIFGIYGEIKEIRETPHKHHHKFIEFYDVRAAEAALHALNRSDIAGKKIKLEPSRPGGARRCSMQQLSSELEQEELSGSWQGSPNNSLPGCFGSSSLGAITTNSLENGIIQGLHSAIKSPVTPLMGTTFHGISSSTSQHLSSPVRIASVANHTDQVAHADINHTLGHMKFGFQGMHGLHPHSLPNYQNGMTNCSPYKSNTMSAMGIGVISRPSEGNDSRHVQKVGSGNFSGHSFDPNKALGVSINGSCPLHGNQHWNNTNAFHHKPTSTMSWSSSPSFVGNVPSHQPSHIHGFPGAQPHMLNTVLPLHQHVGSAPAVNPSLWERRHVYAGDAMEPPVFHPGSLGSMGLSSIPQLESLASRNFFSHSGGNCLDPCISSAHAGIPSPQQRGQMFHGRNPMIPLPGSFDGPNDRMRSRRNDTNSNQGDNKKQYELDIERIMRGEDSRTTLMIKNIPNKYTSKMLLAAIDENHRGTYDFIYLPIDFKNKCNVGYAFINMINPQHIIPFYQSFNGKKWEKFNSEKVASLAYARIQGKVALIAHFQNSSLMNEDKRCRPILFHTEGPNAGDQEPFPLGVNIRSRSGRSRTTNGAEENHQGVMPTSTNIEASSDAVGSSPGSAKDLE